LAEVLEDVFGFEVDAFDVVIKAASADGGPIDNASVSGTGCTCRFAGRFPGGRRGA